MKKTVYLIIISVLTIGCIIFGSLYHTRGNHFFDFRNWVSFSKSISDSDDWDFDDYEVGSNRIVKGEIDEKLPAFTDIEVKANVMNLVIGYGSDFRIESTYGREYLRPIFEVKNGTLKIEQHMPKHTRGNNNCKTVISIPKNASLEDMNLKLNVGEVRIADISGKDCEIKNNVGEVDLDKVDFNDISVKNNVGEVHISVNGDLDDYSLDVATDVGELSVDGRNYKKSYSKKGNAKKSIEVKTNVGEIRIR